MKYGKCKICGKVGKLTFEHIPPKGANNDRRAMVITGEELLKTVTDENRDPWNYDGLKYINEQKGMGLYSLCSECNNLTGAFYGTEYIKMTNTFLKLIFDNRIDDSDYGYIDVGLENVYIARFIKQVLSMFCGTTLGLTTKYPSIKRLILNKDAKYRTKPKYRISMFLLKEYRIGYTGVNVLFDHGNIQTVSEIDAYPFGFIFEYDPKGETDNLDIMEFLKYSYNESANLRMRIPIRERNIMFPLDYRKKEEIKKNSSS